MRRVLSWRSTAMRCASERRGSCCSTACAFRLPEAARSAAAGSREKVVVIMGATGTGKSKLSLDLALRIKPPAEVVNSDKMQVYVGLDLTTNKITAAERRAVRHHLLGELDPASGELSPAAFRALGGAAIADIAARRRLPIVAGGSNSFIHALLVDRYDPGEWPFDGASGYAAALPAKLRYRACLLWVDVAAPVLHEYLDRRVEEMLSGGMFEELAENYDPGRRRRGYVGPWRAIGVPEFDRYFESFPPGHGGGMGKAAAYAAAVAAVKASTRRLAAVQVGKIRRLCASGWPLRRLDATAAVEATLEGRVKGEVEAAWERDVVGPSLAAVEELLEIEEEDEEEKTAAAMAAEEEFLGLLRLTELHG